MPISEQIYTLLRALPQDQASKILTFAEFVYTQWVNTEQLNATTEPIASRSLAFNLALDRLDQITSDLPTIDPVALIRAGRDELDTRCML